MNAPDMIRVQDPAPVYERFEWVRSEAVKPALPAAAVLQLTGKTRDVVAGVSIILGVLEKIETDASFEDDEGKPLAPLFDPVDAFSLRRLAMASLEMLRDAVEDYQESVMQHYPRTTPPTSQG